MKTGSASWCVGVLLLVGTLTAAEAAGPLTQVGSWMSLGSPAHDLVIEGDLAYVVTDLGLTIVNISNPAAPLIQGSVKLGGKGYGVAVKGNYVFAVNISTDLKIIDVSNSAAPVVVASKIIPGAAWDVAVKDDVAYVAGMSGEVYLIDISDPLHPQQFKALGLIAWSRPGSDTANLKKLNQYVTGGNAKTTGVSVAGNRLITFDWGYGRAYHYNVADAHNPIFAGTHYAPFTFRGEIDPAGTTAYMLAAYGYSSGIYSMPLSLLDPWKSTYHATCAPCDFFASPPTDYGGMGISANGRYVMYIAGKQPEVQVVDVSDPTNMRDVGSVAIPPHQARTAQSMGVAQHGDYIITVGAALGLGVFHFPGLSIVE